MCHGCGWNATCERCDKPLTWHRGAARLRCHHCGADAARAAAVPAMRQRRPRRRTASAPSASNRRSARTVSRRRRSFASIVKRRGAATRSIDLLGRLAAGPSRDPRRHPDAGQGSRSAEPDHGRRWSASMTACSASISAPANASRNCHPGRGARRPRAQARQRVAADASTGPSAAARADRAAAMRASRADPARGTARVPDCRRTRILRCCAPKRRRADRGRRISRATRPRWLRSAGRRDRARPDACADAAPRRHASAANCCSVRSNAAHLHGFLSHWCRKCARCPGAHVRWSIDVDPIDLY